MKKRTIDRTKSLFNTALLMLKDLEVIDQSGVKNINAQLDKEIEAKKHKIEPVQEEQKKPVKIDYAGVGGILK